jgi:hypothetical protein
MRLRDEAERAPADALFFARHLNLPATFQRSKTAFLLALNGPPFK